jgi:hypothetical protein
MKFKKSKTETYIITDIDGLDPITVYVTNYKPGQGKLVIECFGTSWANYWPAMGDCTLQDFVLKASNDYLARKMVRQLRQTDFDKINDTAHKRGFADICVASDVEVAYSHRQMAACFGSDWMLDIPTCNTREYDWFCSILNSVKAAFHQEMTEA